MQEGFQNIREEDVVKELEKSEESRRWIPCITKFCRARKFKLEYDRKIRRSRKTNL